MQSVADIAREAFDALAASIGGVVRDCVLWRLVSTGYDPGGGGVTEVWEEAEGRAVYVDAVTSTSPAAALIEPGDRVVVLEGLDLTPRAGDRLEIGEDVLSILRVDGAAAPALVTVVAR